MREMKDSGIEWIGEIPIHWNVIKLNNLASKITDYVASGSFADLNANVEYLDVPDYAMLVRTADLSKTKDKRVYINQHAYEFLSNSNLFGGELILSNIGSVGNVFIYEPMYERSSLAPNAIMIDGSPNNKFLYYWFLNPIANEELKRMGGNAVQLKFNKTQLKQFKILCPPEEEQQLIVDCLDSKCSQIDAIIEKQQAIIEKLKEYKLSIITEVVTKGMNPNVEMKDSGYEYIGLVPYTWEICRLRNIGIPQNGISKGAEFFGEGYPFVSYGDVYRNYSLPQNVNGLIMSTEEERDKYSVREKDIFFTRTSETIEEVGFSSICEETIPNATYAGFVIRVRPFNDKLTNSFAKYYFRGEHHRIFLAKEMNLVTRASLGQDLLKSMPVLVPPKAEQDQIADYLDNKCRLIDQNIIEKQNVIAKLQEYKKSLIYEVVTGKKEI